VKDTLRYLVQDSLVNFTQMVVDACHSTVDCDEGMEWGSDVINSPFKYAHARLLSIYRGYSIIGSRSGFTVNLGSYLLGKSNDFRRV